jgi:hypothetical protein
MNLKLGVSNVTEEATLRFASLTEEEMISMISKN